MRQLLHESRLLLELFLGEHLVLGLGLGLGLLVLFLGEHLVLGLGLGLLVLLLGKYLVCERFSCEAQLWPNPNPDLVRECLLCALLLRGTAAADLVVSTLEGGGALLHLHPHRGHDLVDELNEEGPDQIVEHPIDGAKGLGLGANALIAGGVRVVG